MKFSRVCRNDIHGPIQHQGTSSLVYPEWESVISFKCWTPTYQFALEIEEYKLLEIEMDRCKRDIGRDE